MAARQQESAEGAGDGEGEGEEGSGDGTGGAGAAGGLLGTKGSMNRKARAACKTHEQARKRACWHETGVNMSCLMLLLLTCAAASSSVATITRLWTFMIVIK